MALHINSRQHLKERQEVKPLTIDEEEKIIHSLDLALIGSLCDVKLVQRLIYNYENLKHSFIVSQSKSYNMEVNYEIVESKMNNNG